MPEQEKTFSVKCQHCGEAFHPIAMARPIPCDGLMTPVLLVIVFCRHCEKPMHMDSTPMQEMPRIEIPKVGLHQ